MTRIDRHRRNSRVFPNAAQFPKLDVAGSSPQARGRVHTVPVSKFCHRGPHLDAETPSFAAQVLLEYAMRVRDTRQLESVAHLQASHMPIVAERFSVPIGDGGNPSPSGEARSARWSRLRPRASLAQANSVSADFKSATRPTVDEKPGKPRYS